MKQREPTDNGPTSAESAIQPQQAATRATVASPCIGVCVLDQNDQCEGCFRTADEIAGWTRMDDEARREVVRQTWQRAKASGSLL